MVKCVQSAGSAMVATSGAAETAGSAQHNASQAVPGWVPVLLEEIEYKAMNVADLLSQAVGNCGDVDLEVAAQQVALLVRYVAIRGRELAQSPLCLTDADRAVFSFALRKAIEPDCGDQAQANQPEGA